MAEKQSEKIKTMDRESWNPKTSLGKMVKNGEITSVEEIFDMGKPIIEPEIVDILLPNMEAETLQLSSTQRVTDSGKKISFRAVVVIGDANGHVAIGVGKSDEVKPAIDYAIRDAKKHIISIKMGCGSWECKCGGIHSIPRKVIGKQGSTIVVLKPAPKGLGLAANKIVKTVLRRAGVKDVWSSSLGQTANVYNTAIATIKALNNLTNLKPQPAS